MDNEKEAIMRLEEPLEPLPPSTENDCDRLARVEAVKRLRGLFPDDLCARFYYQENREWIDKPNTISGSIEAYVYVLFRMMVDLAGKYCDGLFKTTVFCFMLLFLSPVLLLGMVLFTLISYFWVDSEQTKLDCCEDDISFAAKEYIEDWVYWLQCCQKEGGDKECRYLDEYCYPKCQSQEVKGKTDALYGILRDESSRRRVMEQFAKNVRDGVDLCDTGRICSVGFIVVSESEGVLGIRIKRDRVGYYLTW